MSIMENVYFYQTPSTSDSPVWHRLEKYESCDVKTEKKSFFTRLTGKKRK